MIRNFVGIAKGTLALEIDALKEAVADGSADRAISAKTVEAIDHVRGLGNIGAHMEKDIDVIVPVDPDEAQHMLHLIEILFEKWYGARERRTQKLSSIAKLGKALPHDDQPSRESLSKASPSRSRSNPCSPIFGSHGSRCTVHNSYVGANTPGWSSAPSMTCTSSSERPNTDDPQVGQKWRFVQARVSPVIVTASAAKIAPA
jgi:hypothetical protein